MSRDFSQIEAAALASQAVVAKDNTLSLPPGFINGFTVLLRKDYTVMIGGGAANVGGIQVKLDEDHQLTLQDWVVPRFNSPNHYFIYLAKDGHIWVDIVKPVYNAVYGYYEQPREQWRMLGRLFVVDTDIVFASGQFLSPLGVN